MIFLKHAAKLLSSAFDSGSLYGFKKKSCLLEIKDNVFIKHHFITYPLIFRGKKLSIASATRNRLQMKMTEAKCKLCTVESGYFEVFELKRVPRIIRIHREKEEKNVDDRLGMLHIYKGGNCEFQTSKQFPSLAKLFYPPLQAI